MIPTRDVLAARAIGAALEGPERDLFAGAVAQIKNRDLFGSTSDGTEGEADPGDFAGWGMFLKWDRPGAWEWRSMRIAHHTLEWGPDDPTRVVDLCSEMLYSRVLGVPREEMETPRFAPGGVEAARFRLACPRYAGWVHR